MTGTTRCFSNEVWETFEERMERVIKAQPRLTALRQSWSTCASCRPLSMMRRWFPSPKKSAVAVLGENCLASNPATTGGEDFSYFMQRVPGAIALLGTGNEACGAVWPNHSGNFCVDEAQLLKGAMLYAQVAMDFNAQ